MLRVSLVDSALNRLSAHFGSRLIAYPPAGADRLAQLEHVAGPLPREFTIFLSTCNGLRIHANGRESELHLWGTHEVLSSVVGPTGPGVPMDLLPVRGDPTGGRDWIVMGHGPAGGAIARWDPWVPGCEIVALSFGSYLDAWANYLIERYRGDGSAQQGESNQPIFDWSYIARFDKDLKDLRNDPRVRDWVHCVDHAVSCGDDYE